MDSIPGTEIEKPEVTLIGEDGNAFSIIGRCTKALKRAGAPRGVIDAFTSEAMSGDYNHLLRTAAKYCEVS